MLDVHLTPAQLAALRDFGGRLIAANRRVNLTAITDPLEIVERHFLDSLAVVAHPVAAQMRAERGANLSILDVGAGAGFPGLPVAIAWPDNRVVLLEATGKKAAFIAETAAALGQTNAAVITERAEEVAHDPDHRERYPLVLARALAPLPILMELTLPFVAPGGSLLLHKTWPWQAEVAEARAACAILGGAFSDLPEAPPDEASPRRILLPVAKVGPTPAAYPRRPGMPAKRPLR